MSFPFHPQPPTTNKPTARNKSNSNNNSTDNKNNNVGLGEKNEKIIPRLKLSINNNNNNKPHEEEKEHGTHDSSQLVSSDHHRRRGTNGQQKKKFRLLTGSETSGKGLSMSARRSAPSIHAASSTTTQSNREPACSMLPAIQFTPRAPPPKKEDNNNDGRQESNVSFLPLISNMNNNNNNNAVGLERNDTTTASILSSGRSQRALSSIEVYDALSGTSVVCGASTRDATMHSLDAFEFSIKQMERRAAMEAMQEEGATVTATISTNSLSPVTTISPSKNHPGHTSRRVDQSCERVTRALFQLSLAMHSNVLNLIQKRGPQRFIRDLRRELRSLGLSEQKQLGRDELHALVCHTLRERNVSKTETSTMFDLFDADLSGLVSCEEMLTGMRYLIEINPTELAYKIMVSMVLSEELSVKNSLISRFELNLLVNAVAEHAERYHIPAPVIDRLKIIIDGLDFKFNRGRVPIELLQRATVAVPEVYHMFMEDTVESYAGSDDGDDDDDLSADLSPMSLSPQPSSMMMLKSSPAPTGLVKRVPTRPRVVHDSVLFGEHTVKGVSPQASVLRKVSFTKKAKEYMSGSDDSMSALENTATTNNNNNRHHHHHHNHHVSAATILRRMQPDRYLSKQWERQRDAPENEEATFFTVQGVIYRQLGCEEPTPYFV
eukprot:PhM_4_TR15834/c0_g1_i1/m.42047